MRDEVNAARADLRRRVVAEREADRTKWGARYLARLDAGESLRALAADANVPCQRLAAWARAARAARDER